MLVDSVIDLPFQKFSTAWSWNLAKPTHHAQHGWCNESTITHHAHPHSICPNTHKTLSNLEASEPGYAQKPSLSICLTTAQTLFSSEASFVGTPSSPEAPTCMIISLLLILHGNLLFLFQCLLFSPFYDEVFYDCVFQGCHHNLVPCGTDMNGSYASTGAFTSIFIETVVTCNFMAWLSCMQSRAVKDWKRRQVC